LPHFIILDNGEDKNKYFKDNNLSEQLQWHMQEE
jgi:hypothetical protein